MNYSTKVMENNTNEWAQTGTVVSLAGLIFGVFWKWINESFKNRREEREQVIRIAVREAMSDIKNDIAEIRKENHDGLRDVHKRIDDVLREVKK